MVIAGLQGAGTCALGLLVVSTVGSLAEKADACDKIPLAFDQDQHYRVEQQQPSTRHKLARQDRLCLS